MIAYQRVIKLLHVFTTFNEPTDRMESGRELDTTQSQRNSQADAHKFTYTVFVYCLLLPLLTNTTTVVVIKTESLQL